MAGCGVSPDPRFMTAAEAWSHVAKVGGPLRRPAARFDDAVIDRSATPPTSHVLSVRHHRQARLRSHHFTGSLRWLGIPRRPRLSGRARRQWLHRTLDLAPSRAMPQGPGVRRRRRSPTGRRSLHRGRYDEPWSIENAEVTPHHERPTEPPWQNRSHPRLTRQSGKLSKGLAAVQNEADQTLLRSVMPLAAAIVCPQWALSPRTNTRHLVRVPGPS